jgi:hypothetical protein
MPNGETAPDGNVVVTVAPSGRVTRAVLLSGPLAGTRIGACIERALLEGRVRSGSTKPVPVTRPLARRQAGSGDKLLPEAQPPDAIPFDTRATAARIARAAADVDSQCSQPGPSRRTVSVLLTLATTGKATRVQLADGALAGTPTAACIEGVFGRVSVPPFGGGPVTLTKAVTLGVAPGP